MIKFIGVEGDQGSHAKDNRHSSRVTGEEGKSSYFHVTMCDLSLSHTNTHN